MSAAEEKKRKTFFILDGTSYAYRSFFAIQHLSNSQGMPTNAVYGFARALEKLLRELRPDYVAVSFDLKGPTFRHEQFKDYKAHRPGMPQELVVQLPLVRELVAAYNIPVVELRGFEADDVMGTLAHKAKALGLETTILTGDKDMLQFVDDDVRVMSTAKENLIYDAAAVKEKFGVDPSRVVHVLALTGDSSDNIPGVPGIGPKTAAALVQEYGGLDEIYRNAEKIKSAKTRETLLANKDRAFTNLDLVRVRTDAPVPVSIEDCRRKDPDKPRLLDLFKRMEFGALMKDMMEETPAAEVKDVVVVDAADGLHKRMKEITAAGACVFDLVTTSADPMRAEILGAVFRTPSGEPFYAALGKDLPLKDFVSAVQGILESSAVGKTGHDLQYDAVVLLKEGIVLQGIAFDTMLASYLLNPSKMHHGIGDLALDFLNHRMTTVADILGKGKTARLMTDIPVPELARYAGEEADVIARLHAVLAPLLESKQLEKLFRDVEIPLEMVLAKMEYTGMRADPEILRELSKECENQMQDLTRRIYLLAGQEFNISSTKELAFILFEKMGMPHHRKTKTGYSTDADVLTSLARSHELPALILNYRMLSKLKSTYSDALPMLIHPKTGRIHTSFHQTVTATGRLSSSDPNLQNIPVKTEMGLRIRSAFVPGEPSQVLLGADYSQIELRILAHFSGDENLREAFRKDLDVHRHTAGLVFGVPAEEVGDDQRRKAKIVNFGILYGMGSFSLAKDMEVTPPEAQAFIDAYFQRYGGVHAFIQKVVEKAREDKCVTTILGRRRYIPEISSTNFSLRQFAERTAVNTVVQGSAADIIKMAMLEVDKELSAKKWKAKMLLQIHDELVFEVDKGQAEELAAMVRGKMEKVVELDVPLKVDVNTGGNWAEI